MSAESLPDDARQVMQLTFAGPERPSLSAVNALLYDLELTHALAALLAQKRDETQKLVTPYFFFRNGHQLDENHEALVARLTKASPLTIEMVVAGIGVLWVLVQIFDKVSTWQQTRQKLELENRKLRYEAELKRLELQEKYDTRLKLRQAEQIQQQLVSRLERSSFQLIGISHRKDGPTDA